MVVTRGEKQRVQFEEASKQSSSETLSLPDEQQQPFPPNPYDPPPPGFLPYPLACPACFEYFNTGEDYYSHQHVFHRAPMSRSCSCTPCQITFGDFTMPPTMTEEELIEAAMHDPIFGLGDDYDVNNTDDILPPVINDPTPSANPDAIQPSQETNAFPIAASQSISEYNFDENNLNETLDPELREWCLHHFGYTFGSSTEEIDPGLEEWYEENFGWIFGESFE